MQQARGAALAESVHTASEGARSGYDRCQRGDGAEVSETEIGEDAEERAYDRFPGQDSGEDAGVLRGCPLPHAIAILGLSSGLT